MKNRKTILSHFKPLFSPRQYQVSFDTLKHEIRAFLSVSGLIILLGIIILGFIGCKTSNFIPVETNNSVTIRDSIIEVTDTLIIEVPKEKIIEIVPADTLSQLETSNAKSIARVEGGSLYHSLEQFGTLDIVIDTFYTTRTIEVIKEKEIPVEIEKPVEYIPKWINYSILFNLMVLVLVVLKIYLKFKI